MMRFFTSFRIRIVEYNKKKGINTRSVIIRIGGQKDDVFKHGYSKIAFHNTRAENYYEILFDNGRVLFILWDYEKFIPILRK